MSAKRASDPRLSLHETFDRVHDGGVVIDPDKCALALFVTKDGQVRVKSPYSAEEVAGMLEQLAVKLRARKGADPGQWWG